MSSRPSDVALDWSAIRAQFPALSHWTHLNTATFGQLPQRSVAAMDAHFARRDELACQDFLSWFDDADRIRELVARLIHCEPAHIAFIPNASTAISLLLGGLDWRTGDQILTLENEFPNHYYFPAHLARCGVQLVETSFERFYEAVTPRTRVAVLSTVNYATGFRAPLKEIAAFLRSRDILLYLDGTQSLGALEFDVSAIQPDMFAVNGYKWLCSPNGAAFMYVSPMLCKRLPPAVIGWRSDRNWRSVADLNHGAPEFVNSAEKYEGGMLAFAPLYGMAESISLFLEIGPSLIEARVLELAGEVRRMLDQAGAEVAFADSPIVAARFPNRPAEALAEEMKKRRVLVAARHGYLRVSPHLYNSENDLEKLQEIVLSAK